MKHTYIIAEIGQNHNGDLELAKKLIDLASMPIYDHFGERQLKPIDAIKLCKRDLSEELTEEEYNRPYESPHSFGKTYGEHREHLELDYKDYVTLEKYARSKGLDFVVTLCSPKTLKLTNHVKIDYIKVASRDLTNIPLLEKIAETKIPVILSRGMSDHDEVEDAVKIIEKHHNKISILHCISQYPAEYKNLNLAEIQNLKKKFGHKFKIGYSDHSIGIMAPVMAVALGAEIIEKHITLNRKMKGSDHAGSLEMEGLWRMARDIRNAEESFGREGAFAEEVVKDAMRRLRRSLALKKDIKKGEKLTESMLTMLSPGNGLRWHEKEKILGKKAIKNIKAKSHIFPDMFK